MKRGFTMIELVFVIAILGILAVVIFPRFSLTRTNAKATVIATRLANCLTIASKAYILDGIFDTNNSNCKEVSSVINCYTIDENNIEGTLHIQNGTDSHSECKESQEITFRNKLSSSLGITHQF